MAGQVLSRIEADSKPEADPSQHYYYFGGKLMGANGNNGNGRPDFTTSLAETTQAPATGNATRAFRAGAIGTGSDNGLTDGANPNPFADFDQAYDPVSASSFSGGAQSWTVKQGETLEGIAQNLWGDASLWYMLAQENGMRSSSELRVGQLLQVPNKLANFHNTADTFRPYDASQAIGDTQPTTPKPPKKPKCGVFGQIFLVVIAIAVAAILQQYQVFAFLGNIGSLAASAAVGSVVSQGVGVATGIQDKFWTCNGFVPVTYLITPPWLRTPAG
jgi:LysM repeat protein